jgi:hypothetical protein
VFKHEKLAEIGKEFQGLVYNRRWDDVREVDVILVDRLDDVRWLKNER